ncbi:MAG: hypothetical protein ABIJ40_03305, partial [Bacteroidota bacterium]
KMGTSYIGFGNNQLKDAVDVKKDDLIECKLCCKTHPIEYGTSDGKENNLLGFYKCGEKLYLASVVNKLVMGMKVACSGKI